MAITSEAPKSVKLYVTDLNGNERHIGYVRNTSDWYESSLAVSGFIHFYMQDGDGDMLMPAGINLSTISSWRLSYE